MTIDDMKRGVSNLRNRVIARVFQELKLIEQWGSGVKRIFAEAQTLGLPEPTIEEIGLHLRFTIYLSNTISAQTVGGPSALRLITPNSHTQERLESEQELDARLESRLESNLAARVVLSLHVQPEGKAALARQLGHKTVSGELHKQIRRLLDQSVIEMTLPDKPNSRLQQYRLTSAGQTLLAQLKDE